MPSAGLGPSETLRSDAELRRKGERGRDTGSVQRHVSGDLWSTLWPSDARVVGGIPKTGGKDESPGSLSGGRGSAPGGRGAHGGVVGPIGRGPNLEGPNFSAPVPAGGYAWWYVDALSDDGRFGLTVIAFIGSVFSPYYAWSGRTDPLNHCALNIALYGASGRRWAMTERGRSSLRREPGALSIGPSTLTWEDDVLTIRFDEVTAPIPARVRGVVRLRPKAMLSQGFVLAACGRHVWRPIAPRADVEAELELPACSWRGEGYFDTNCGDEPLEDGFSGWEWSRAHLKRDTLVFYDVRDRDGRLSRLAMRIDPRGDLTPIEPLSLRRLPSTRWRMARNIPAEASSMPRVRETLEDTPFYSRSMIEGRYEGELATIIHESLSLDRLRSSLVRAMLPFRMPRALR